MTNNIERIIDSITRATGKEPDDWPKKVRTTISMRILRMLQKSPWDRPKDSEKELDLIMRDIRSLRKRVQSLHRHTAVLARRAADADEVDEAERAIVAATDANDREGRERAIERLELTMNVPQSDWVDKAAIRHLDELQRCLTIAAESVINAAPAGPGRPKNRHAIRAALEAALIFQEITGKMPTFWNGGTTPYSRLVQEVFAVAGIRAHLRQPIEAAMRKLKVEK